MNKIYSLTPFSGQILKIIHDSGGRVKKEEDILAKSRIRD